MFVGMYKPEQYFNGLLDTPVLKYWHFVAKEL